MDTICEITNQVPTPETLIARAESMIPRLLERSARTDADRRVPAETIRELRDADLLRVVQPGLFGGLGLEQIYFLEITRTLARGCASTAWTYAVLAGHAGYVTAFPEQAWGEVWSDRSALVCSAYAPTGHGISTEGGYIVSGSFPFSSGSDYASWAAVGGRVEDGEAPGKAMNFLIPMDELTVVDNWHTVGLRGTGSKTLLADNLFVPAHRVIPAPTLDHTTVPFGLCAVVVGAAEGGIDRFIEHTTGRVSPVTGLKAEASEVIQASLAESAAEVDAAWLLIERDVLRAQMMRQSSRPSTDLEKARNRRDQAYVARLAARAVDRLYSATGGSGIYNKSPMQQVFRDVRAATLHPSMSWELAAPQVGRVLLKAEYRSAF